MKDFKTCQPEKQHSVICDKYDPKLPLREASKCSTVRQLLQRVYWRMVSKCCHAPLVCSVSTFSAQMAMVRRSENPSQSRPGSPHCCCGGSLMEDVVSVPWTEAESQLRQEGRNGLIFISKEVRHTGTCVFHQINSALQESDNICHFRANQETFVSATTNLMAALPKP